MSRCRSASHTRLEESTIEIMLRLKLEQVGLEGFEYYMPSQLSRGMKNVPPSLARWPWIRILFFDDLPPASIPSSPPAIDQLILELKQAIPHDHHRRQPTSSPAPIESPIAWS